MTAGLQGSPLSSPSSSMPHVSRSQLAGGQKQRSSWSDRPSDNGSCSSSWVSSLPSLSRAQLQNLPASSLASNRPQTVCREALLAAEARAVLVPGSPNPNVSPGMDTGAGKPSPGAASMLDQTTSHQTTSYQLLDPAGAEPLRSGHPAAAAAATASASLHNAIARGWPNPFEVGLWGQDEGAEAPADAPALACHHGVPAEAVMQSEAEAVMQSEAEQLPRPRRSSSIPIPAVAEVG